MDDISSMTAEAPAALAIVYRSPTDLKAYGKNSRTHTPEQIDSIRASIREFGFTNPILLKSDGTTIGAGHARWQAATAEGLIAVPTITLDGLTDAQWRAYVIADNQLAINGSGWDSELLASELLILNEDGFDLSLLGFSDDNLASLLSATEPDIHGTGIGSLSEQFLIAPFSVLNAREGWWQDRKRQWLALGIKSEEGRIAPTGGSAMVGGYIDGVRQVGLGDKMADPKQYGRTFGQDIMRGEHEVGKGKKKASVIPGGGGGGAWKGGPRTASSDKYREPIKERVGVHGPWSNHPSYYPQKNTIERRLGRSLSNAEFEADWFIEPDGEIATGTSIFDPVLTELAYRWFSPPGGSILDPFAGGSVRGIVAAKLGRQYVGIDLRVEQVAANEGQWVAMNHTQEEMVEVKISAAMARLRFHGCDPDYIRDVCHAACCKTSSQKSGTLITINEDERAKIEARGGVVIDGRLQSPDKHCPFEDCTSHLCTLHFTPDKPFGCIASPFTLNKSGTLIVRNRYRLLRCYNVGPQLPAYIAFWASLDLIFGEAEAQRISDHLDAGGGDMAAQMPLASYQRLRSSDALKHGEKPDLPGPRWLVGDSGVVLAGDEAGDGFDFVFSCPPYADLEVYSDDPADISTMDYPDFLAAYRDIIAKSCAKLKPDRFACFVVGDLRDKKGNYRNFVGDTVEAFRAAGMELYNEAILVTAVGSLPIRVGRQFSVGRKLGKTHQNVLVFVKGDGKRAAEACGPVDVTDALAKAIEPEEETPEAFSPGDVL